MRASVKVRVRRVLMERTVRTVRTGRALLGGR
jgi:hypothetical protein